MMEEITKIIVESLKYSWFDSNDIATPQLADTFIEDYKTRETTSRVRWYTKNKLHIFDLSFLKKGLIGVSNPDDQTFQCGEVDSLKQYHSSEVCTVYLMNLTNVPDPDPERIEIDTDKVKTIKYLLNGQLHRPDGRPALIKYYKTPEMLSRKETYRHGILHSYGDVPAIRKETSHNELKSPMTYLLWAKDGKTSRLGDYAIFCKTKDKNYRDFYYEGTYLGTDDRMKKIITSVQDGSKIHLRYEYSEHKGLGYEILSIDDETRQSISDERFPIFRKVLETIKKYNLEVRNIYYNPFILKGRLCFDKHYQGDYRFGKGDMRRYQYLATESTLIDPEYTYVETIPEGHFDLLISTEIVTLHLYEHISLSKMKKTTRRIEKSLS